MVDHHCSVITLLIITLGGRSQTKLNLTCTLIKIRIKNKLDEQTWIRFKNSIRKKIYQVFMITKTSEIIYKEYNKCLS